MHSTGRTSHCKSLVHGCSFHDGRTGESFDLIEGLHTQAGCRWSRDSGFPVSAIVIEIVIEIVISRDAPCRYPGVEAGRRHRNLVVALKSSQVKSPRAPYDHICCHHAPDHLSYTCRPPPARSTLHIAAIEMPTHP
jgi:hypothetical protein